jgi:hypothetical protein
LSSGPPAAGLWSCIGCEISGNENRLRVPDLGRTLANRPIANDFRLQAPRFGIMDRGVLESPATIESKRGQV